MLRVLSLLSCVLFSACNIFCQEAPLYTQRGALTQIGHAKRLDTRMQQEAALRSSKTILAAELLPSAENLSEWVRLFVTL